MDTAFPVIVADDAVAVAEPAARSSSGSPSLALPFGFCGVGSAEADDTDGSCQQTVFIPVSEFTVDSSLRRDLLSVLNRLLPGERDVSTAASLSGNGRPA